MGTKSQAILWMLELQRGYTPGYVLGNRLIIKDFQEKSDKECAID
jgi:hypothetical protein